MTHKISILVRADVGRDAIELLVTGCLTLDTAGILATQVTKARRLDPSAPILLDLRDAQHIDADALERMRSRVDVSEVNGRPVASLQFLMPEPTPQCQLTEAAFHTAH